MSEIKPTEQLEFLPPKPLRGKFKRVNVSTVLGDRGIEMIGPKGTKAFCRSIEVVGVTTPIQLELKPSGEFRIIDGRRRLRAVIELGQRESPEGVTTREWKARWSKIPAYVLPPGGWSPEVLAAHANEQRGENVATLLNSAEFLVDKGLSEAEVVEILGIPVQRLRRVLRMRALEPSLRAALEADAISQTIAEDVAKLPEHMQARLAEAFKEKGEITAAMVREVRRVRREASLADSLPLDGMEDRLLPSAPAEVTVAGWRHLLAEKLAECVKIADAYQQDDIVKALEVVRDGLFAEASA